MKGYEIQYFNHVGQETSHFYLMARSRAEARRLFRKMYNFEIEGIYEYVKPDFWTEEKINEFIAKNMRV